MAQREPERPTPPTKVSEKGTCTQWRQKGSCSRGEDCLWKATHTAENRNRTRSPKGRGKGNRDGSPRPGRPAYRGGSSSDQSVVGEVKGFFRDTSRKEVVHDGAYRRASRDDEETKVYPKRFRGKSPSGRKNVESCAQWMKGECPNDKCDLWHTPDCRRFATGQCKFGNDCGFRHSKQGTATPVASNTSSDTDDRTPPRVRGNSDKPRRRRKNRNQESEQPEPTQLSSDSDSISEPDHEPTKLLHFSPLNQ